MLIGLVYRLLWCIDQCYDDFGIISGESQEPVIIVHPVKSTISMQGTTNVTLACVATFSGDQPYSFNWRKDAEVRGDTKFEISEQDEKLEREFLIQIQCEIILT